MGRIFRSGEEINGYTLTTDMTTVGSGTAAWAFAKKGEEEFFIKQFLSPVFPSPDSPGSPSVKEMKRKRCEAFEKHHRFLMKLMRERCGPGGLLIYATDFFLFESHYFKVTHKVDISTPNIKELNFEKKILILLTVVQSLKLLHDCGIVHSDLKPDNILIQNFGDRFITKLIDFDSSFQEGELPEPEEIMGDQVYYSPELVKYITTGEKGIGIGCASDIFALGLIFSKYIYGILPDFDSKYHYPCIALLNGDRLRIPDSIEISNDLRRLLHKMLSFNPKDRPTIKEIQDDLKRIKSGKIVTYQCTNCKHIFSTALKPTLCECCDYNVFAIVHAIVHKTKRPSFFKPITQFFKIRARWIRDYLPKTMALSLTLIVLIIFLSYIGYNKYIKYIDSGQHSKTEQATKQVTITIEEALKWVYAESPKDSELKKAVETLKRNINHPRAREGLAKATEIYIQWGDDAPNKEEARRCYELALKSDQGSRRDEILEKLSRLTQIMREGPKL